MRTVVAPSSSLAVLPVHVVHSARHRGVRDGEAKSSWHGRDVPHLRRQAVGLDGAVDGLDQRRHRILLCRGRWLVRPVLPTRAHRRIARGRGHHGGLECLPRERWPRHLLPIPGHGDHRPVHLVGCEGHREGEHHPHDELVRPPDALARALDVDGPLGWLAGWIHVHVQHPTRVSVRTEHLDQRALAIRGSCSAGMGTLITYAVYMRKDEDTTLNAFTMGLANNSISIVAGLTVLSAIFAVSSDPLATVTGGSLPSPSWRCLRSSLRRRAARSFVHHGHDLLPRCPSPPSPRSSRRWRCRFGTSLTMASSGPVPWASPPSRCSCWGRLRPSSGSDWMPKGSPSRSSSRCRITSGAMA